MSTFSKLQRNSFTQNFLKNLFFLVFYVFYSSLASIYEYLPVLLGILFFKYLRDFRSFNFLGIFTVFLCIMFFEIQYSQSLMFIFLMFMFLGFLVNKIATILDEKNILFVVIYIFLPYVGYFFLSQYVVILDSEVSVGFDFWILWYIFVEVCLVLVWRR